MQASKTQSDITILGIETSCDETAAAIVKNGREIKSDVVASQVEFHQKFGGIVPEIASRKHLEMMQPVVGEALEKAGLSYEDLDVVAVTVGPGLVGALLMGLGAAKAISYIKDIPLVGVNHLEGHVYANFIGHPDLRPPLVALLVSGGHTQLVFMPDFDRYELMGQTLDDAVGEAYDKVAAFLGLGYPGGPAIDEIAKDGNPKAIAFPRAMLNKGEFDFSLSGLKTAVLTYVSHLKLESTELPLYDIAASFQAAIVDVLVSKTVKAAKAKGVSNVVLGGGVAANRYLRHQMSNATRAQMLNLYFPNAPMCTDNAVMIAAAAYHRFIAGERLSFKANPVPNLKLGQDVEL